jgi:hypothetical protein
MVMNMIATAKGHEEVEIRQTTATTPWSRGPL